MDEFEFEYEEPKIEGPFQIEADLYDTGDYVRLLIVPCNDSFIVSSGDEHLCTLVHTCSEPDCWEQEDGSLDDELVEKLGAAIQGYINQQ